MHDLVRQIAVKEFEEELRITCELGDKIIEGTKFIEIEKLIDFIEIPKSKNVRPENQISEERA